MAEYIDREALIATIRKELDQSSSTRYCCEDGTIICTDVGYVEDWFQEYVEVLRRRNFATAVQPIIVNPDDSCRYGERRYEQKTEAGAKEG